MVSDCPEVKEAAADRDSRREKVGAFSRNTRWSASLTSSSLACSRSLPIPFRTS